MLHIWDLGWEMARLLSGEAAGSAKWHVVPYEAVDELLGKRRVLSMEELVELGEQVLGKLAKSKSKDITTCPPPSIS